MEQKATVLAIRVDDKYYLGAEIPYIDDNGESDGEDAIDKLSTVIKITNVARTLEAMIPLWFRDKYYSTPKNYYTVLRKANITGDQYKDILQTLIEYGVLEEEKERVYVLCEGFWIYTQEEINRLDR